MSVVLAASDLTIGWSAEAILIEHASFAVEEGEIFGILGRSASGKSTLLRALVGIDQPLSGTIRVQGEDPSRTGVYPRFGVMFQQGALFGSMTVSDNIALALDLWTDLPSDAIHAIARAKLRLVGLERTAEQLPSTLSGGMRKRVALARALALDPQLVFLDEPSSGLDPVTAAEIDRLIALLARELGLAVVLVTHDLESVYAIVDRCILVDHETRSIAATGRPRDLAASTDPRVHDFFARIPREP